MTETPTTMPEMRLELVPVADVDRAEAFYRAAPSS